MTATTATFPECYVLFSKFGDPRSDGKTMTLSQSDKWLKQALILDGKKLTLTDTGLLFSRFKARTVSYSDYQRYLYDVAKKAGMDLEELKNKLMTCGPPGATKVKADVK